MSQHWRYQRWDVSGTYSASIGVSIMAIAHARFQLTGIGLVYEEDTRVRYESVPYAVRTVAISRGNEFRSRPPENKVYNLQFSGIGVSYGPLPVGWGFSTPYHPSTGGSVFFRGHSTTAHMFSRHGVVLEAAASVGHGMGIQVLFFNAPSTVDILMRYGVEEILDAVVNDDTGRLICDNIPMVTSFLGTQSGVSAGITWYEGSFYVTRSSMECIYTPPEPAAELPPGQRPTMVGRRRD